jgi:hypothetical protein
MLDPLQVVECCKSLIVWEDYTGLIRFSHFSVQEFIAGNILEKLPPVQFLAKTCLNYLAIDLDKPSPDIVSLKTWREKYKFLSYAAPYCWLHTKGVAEEFPDVAQAFFRIVG